jgi:hypothetical protein
MDAGNLDGNLLTEINKLSRDQLAEVARRVIEQDRKRKHNSA